MSSAKGASATRGRHTLGDNLKFGLRCGASALALSLVFGATALAQTAAKKDSTEDTVDEVIVTSIKQSLKSSQQLKQSSEIIGDSITAEDIGALPDRSVTEALQRVPGVSINRFAAGVDPDHFSVEGSGVVVRGLNFVRSELNGRDTFTANNGRILSFADVPSELMGGVDVFKSPSADLIEGGISGTVNLRTRLPFDSNKRILSLSAEASYGDMVKKWKPTYSFLYSDRFDTNIGEIGVLASFVNSELASRSDAIQVSNFGCRTNLGVTTGDCGNGTSGVWFPRGAAFRSTTNERERQGQAGAIQWRSNDGTMQAAFQYLRSKSTTKWTEHAVEIATDNVTSNGDSRPAAGTTFTFDEDGVFTNGIITGTTGWRADQNGSDPRTPINGLQSNNIRRDEQTTNLTTDYGFNFKWTPNEHWGIQFDAQHVDSKVDAISMGLWGSTFQNASITLNGSDAPTVTFLPPANGTSVVTCTTYSASCPSYAQGTHTSLSDPYNSFWRSAMDHIEQSEGTEDAVKIDVEYKFDNDSWLDSIKGGVRWSERDQTTRFSAYNWGVISEIWGSGGPVWMTDAINGNPSTAGGSDSTALVEKYVFDNFMRGKVAVPTGSDGRLFYSQNLIENYAAVSQFALSVGDEWRTRLVNGCPQNWVPLAQRCNVVSGTPFRPQEINPVNEGTESAYLMARFKGVTGDYKVSGNVGLRYTKTERVADGYLAFPLASSLPTELDCASVPVGQTPSPFCQLTPAVRAASRLWANGALIPNRARAKFEYLLPSFNLKVMAPHGLQYRFGLSKTITPPDIGLTRNFYNLTLNTNADGITNGVPSGNVPVGNPYLKPTQSKNIDASVEWYFAPVGSLTFAAFYKELTDVAYNRTSRLPFTNNGVTFDVVITQPGNSDVKATVKGFEVGYQQFYDFLPKPLDGFGINANYSYIESSGVPQSTLSATDPDVAAGRITTVDTSKLPLQGLSKHNVNFAAIYEKGPVSARLAYNWRSDFLLTVRDVIVPYAPIMNEATGQLDGSFFYTINPKMKVGVQGVNLLNETTRTTQVLNSSLLKTGRSWFVNDRRYTFVLRASF
ncbi:TonB-dependent receptor [Caulobacter sp. D4A]|uniref:TonB-dependent receptor n=1 Tax=unclassified Caulobacter TaxID=2648921 RepID=UPI000D7334B3|nr:MULTISPECIES: TonB-dependent receptor [unclassified Caulobacter]PXA90682.1 TonB-dependent receptor [Caulobacter sp. D4A]PXA95573.1 TonB-dependent receptor [Caulobacter sp. D5]